VSSRPIFSSVAILVTAASFSAFAHAADGGVETDASPSADAATDAADGEAGVDFGGLTPVESPLPACDCRLGKAARRHPAADSWLVAAFALGIARRRRRCNRP
jgi:hypothetical protein